MSLNSTLALYVKYQVATSLKCRAKGSIGDS